MFSSVGWGEILVLLIVGLIVVGPERLPRIITDLKAMVHAARSAVASAKKELGDDFTEDFEDFRRPLAQLNDVRKMGARGLVSKALLDDDPDFLRDMESTARGVAGTVTGRGTGRTSAGTTDRADRTDATPSVPAASPQPGTEPVRGTEHTESADRTDTTRPARSWDSLDEGDVL